MGSIKMTKHTMRGLCCYGASDGMTENKVMYHRILLFRKISYVLARLIFLCRIRLDWTGLAGFIKHVIVKGGLDENRV